MAVGYEYTKTGLDAQMGRLITALRDDFLAIQSFNNQLLDPTLLPAATLVALGYSGTTPYGTDYNTIHDSFAALQILYNISTGSTNLPVAFDFWAAAKHISNQNFH